MFRFIDIKVNDIGLLGILVYLAGNSVIKSGTATEEQIAFADRPVSGNRPVHAIPIT